MCKRYDYVAVGGIARRKKGQTIWDYMPALIDEAHRHHAKIHGLGFTRTSALRDIRFDTVDSSSWTTAGRYGVISKFTGDQIQLRQHKEGFRTILRGNELQIINGKEWVKFQKYAKEHL